jgi:hypothetical protein
MAGKKGKQLKEMQKRGHKSPRIGKHGKRKTTIALEEALKRRAEHIVDELLIEREKIINGLNRVRSRAKYRDLIDGLDKTTKNIQLLTGKDTEKINFGLDAIGIVKNKNAWRTPVYEKTKAKEK